MKRMAWIAFGAALLLAVSAAAQSLGDAARAARKSKQPNAGTRYFDNDNLPKDSHLSIVGPEPAAEAPSANPATDADKTAQKEKADTGTAEAAKPAPDEKAATSTAEQAEKPAQSAKEPSSAPANTGSGAEAKPVAPDAKAASDSSKKEDAALKTKIQEQKQKIETLSKDLDLTQREYRLRAVAMYSDAGNRLRNASQWDKDDAQYKKDIADKQAAVDSAKKDLDDMLEQSRKSGANTADQQ